MTISFLKLITYQTLSKFQLVQCEDTTTLGAQLYGSLTIKSEFLWPSLLVVGIARHQVLIYSQQLT